MPTPVFVDTSGSLGAGQTSHETTVVPDETPDWYFGSLTQQNLDFGSGASSGWQPYGSVVSTSGSGLVVQVQDMLGVWKNLMDVNNYSQTILVNPGQLYRMARGDWHFRIANTAGVTRSWSNFSWGLRDNPNGATPASSPVCYAFDSGWVALTASPQELIGQRLGFHVPFGDLSFGSYFTVETEGAGVDITPIFWRYVSGVESGPFNLLGRSTIIPGEFVTSRRSSGFPFIPGDSFVFGAQWTGSAP